MAISSGFRQYLPKPGDYNPLQGLDKTDIYELSEALITNPKFKDLFDSWSNSLEEPFRGITANGVVADGIYPLQSEGAPTTAAVIAANRIIDALTPDEALRALHTLESEDWRKWSNTEIIKFDSGIRLEKIEQSKIDLIWKLFEASLSKNGYAKVRAAVKFNRFLGQITQSPAVMNENSYFFSIFGRPSKKNPWGFSVFGHHLAINVFFVGEQMVIGPVFVGCEPNIIDEGPDKGTQLFRPEASLALKLMQSLSPEQQQKARKTDKIHQPEESTWNVIDQRHRAGTAKDNRIIPYEGIVASSLTPEQQDLLVDIVATFSEMLPEAPLQHRLSLVREHLSETYFTWIGHFGDTDPFYYRIQSPVVLVELDHHTGIHLTNKVPDKFHIHTICRLPNGGDYGQALIRQWKKAHPGKPRAERMEYVRPFDEDDTVDTGFPKYRAQILSNLESAIILASHIGEGGCGPGLHYHHSDQFYYLVKGTMKVRLGEKVLDVAAGSLVFIPAGLPHCNWNDGPDSETHLEAIIPAPHRLKQIAYMIEKPEDVPPEYQTTKKGYVRRVDAQHFKEPLPGFKTMALADPSSGSDTALVMYAEVQAGMGGPPLHVHEFDQYYFVLEGTLTIEVALRKYVVPPNHLVILPAGVPHRQYNQADVVEKHVVINTPTPEEGRCWDYGVSMAPNGVSHSGSLVAARDIDDGAF